MGEDLKDDKGEHVIVPGLNYLINEDKIKGLH